MRTQSPIEGTDISPPLRGAALICGKTRRLSLDPTPRSASKPGSGETGQVLVFVVVAMVGLLGMAGLAIDVGRAYFTQRSLQASADAAALAGAQELPDPGISVSVADGYSGKNGAKNHDPGIDDVSTNVYTRCLKSAPGCEPVNAVVVEQTATVSTLFARVLGIDTIDVDVKSTACSPCAAKPLDIMLVLDRTGSMCQDSNGNSDPSCTDLNNARVGMKTFLTFMDPTIDHVGLAVFPPGTTCGTPQTSAYNSAGNPYVLVPLSNDYARDGALDANSSLVQTINCQKGGGRTSYADAIGKAQGELDSNGRPDVRDIIIVLSDGAANTGPSYYSATSPDRMQPCHQGVSSAGSVKGRGTLVYTIGYDLNAEGGDANVCRDWGWGVSPDPFHCAPPNPLPPGFRCADRSKTPAPNPDEHLEVPGISAYSALQQMATSSETFFNKPSPGQLKSIFTKIAADISRPAARLIDNDID
jgi:hypothetical protein